MQHLWFCTQLLRANHGVRLNLHARDRCRMTHSNDKHSLPTLYDWRSITQSLLSIDCSMHGEPPLEVLLELPEHSVAHHRKRKERHESTGSSQIPQERKVIRSVNNLYNFL